VTVKKLSIFPFHVEQNRNTSLSMMPISEVPSVNPKEIQNNSKAFFLNSHAIKLVDNFNQPAYKSICMPKEK